MGSTPKLYTKFILVAKLYWTSDEKWKGIGLLIVMLVTMVVATTLNVRLVTTQGDWMNGLVDRNSSVFTQFIILYLIILAIYVPTNVLTSYIKDRIGILWREWLTKLFISNYLSNRKYYTIEHKGAIDNPDQRIAEDVKLFTNLTIDSLGDIVTSIFQMISFSVLLWNISIPLFFIAFSVSFISTLVSIYFFGVKLANLNFKQNKFEADLRFSLARFRDNVESIAFYRGEEKESISILQRFMEAIQNSLGVIKVSAQYGTFFIGINMLANLIPVIYLAPSYFSGSILIGTITKSQGAFGSLKNSFNIVIKSLKQFSQIAAYTNRLYDLMYTSIYDTMSYNRILTEYSNDSSVELKEISLNTIDGKTKITEKLNLILNTNDNLLIIGPSGCGKTSILRMIAGLWNNGEGKLIIPSNSKSFFISQRPYMPLGTLKDQLCYPDIDKSDEEMILALDKVKLNNLVKRVGGLGKTMDFSSILSLGEQQRIGFARLLLAEPSHAFLDEATSALDEENERILYEQLIENKIQVISVSHHKNLLNFHNKLLTYKSDYNFEFSSIAKQKSKSGNKEEKKPDFWDEVIGNILDALF